MSAFIAKLPPLKDKLLKFRAVAFTCPRKDFKHPGQGFRAKAWCKDEVVHGVAIAQERKPIRLNRWSAALVGCTLYKVKAKQQDKIEDLSKSEGAVEMSETRNKAADTGRLVRSMMTPEATITEKRLTRDCLEAYLAMIRSGM